MDRGQQRHARQSSVWARLCRLPLWLLAICLVAIPMASSAGVFISVNFAPPPLPLYAQPVIPGPGYIWTPGYWSYAGDGGYFWVPGTWVLAPYPGALWTPGYWGWAGGVYVLHMGYWGPRVGFYGGINYGYGYTGVGYVGGYWRHGGFYYNRSVNNIRTTNITNVYTRTVINNTTINRVSYNGGMGGVMARPTEEERLAAREPHTPPTGAQMRQVRMASRQRLLRASVNHGVPTIAATRRPGVFAGRGVIRARPAREYSRTGAHPPMHPFYRHPRPQNDHPYAHPQRVPRMHPPGGPIRRTPPPVHRKPPHRPCCGGAPSAASV